jgi:hypothetical protein
LGVSINDLFLGLTSKVFHKYFEIKKDKNKEISITLPFSFKVIPKKVDDY